MKETDIKVPIPQKLTLTIPEAAAYSNIGVNKISQMLRKPDCSFVLFERNGWSKGGSLKNSSTSIQSSDVPGGIINGVLLEEPGRQRTRSKRGVLV